MKKCLVLATLALILMPFGLRAQSNFTLETDTVCVGQNVRLKPNIQNASSYYWGFCSGFLENNPVDENMGSGFGFSSPTAMEIAKEGNLYFGFVMNANGNQLLRLNFGTSLRNTPTVTNFGSLDTTVCPSPNSLFLTQDSGKWFLFACGGGGGNPSTLARFDFGGTLSNVPNGVRMGNISNQLDDPHGIFVARDGDVYYGYVVNAGDDRLIRLSFGKNISRTPTATDLGNVGSTLFDPSDLAAVYEGGNWYFLITNARKTNVGPPPAVNRLARMFFGNSLSNNPVGSFPLGVAGDQDNPSAITVTKDCGVYHAFITNKGTGALGNTIAKIDITSLGANNYQGETLLVNPLSGPEDISRVIRDRDSIFMFVINQTDNSLRRIVFPSCTNTNIPSSTAAVPPPFKYTTAGTFNIYLEVNSGLPNMAMDCKQITVLNVPPITLSNDTLICQGDTLALSVTSQNALGYFFSPNYNIGDTQGRIVFVYPDESTNYTVRIPFANGCVVDSVIKVSVSSVRADAGPDRSMLDGGTTVLGGPNTFIGAQYTYEWFPTTFLSDPYTRFPIVNPQRDITYYLRVTNTNGCIDIDTVKVKVSCNGFNLPNAFAPDNDRGAPRTYGLLNRQVVQLNYFRIFDRWGRQVFSTNDATKEWDGMFNGERCAFGVYVWEADGFCVVTQERIKASGNVTLIR